MTPTEKSPNIARRLFSAEFKTRMVAQYGESRESVPDIALAYDIAPTLINKWIRQHKQREQTLAAPFVSIPMATTNLSPSSVITISVVKAAMTVTVAWPTSASVPCAAWLREWLQ